MLVTFFFTPFTHLAWNLHLQPYDPASNICCIWKRHNILTSTKPSHLISVGTIVLRRGLSHFIVNIALQRLHHTSESYIDILDYTFVELQQCCWSFGSRLMLICFHRFQFTSVLIYHIVVYYFRVDSRHWCQGNDVN